MASPYTYVFVRRDLSVAQQIVQAAHAAMEAGRQFDGTAGTNIVLIDVADTSDLNDVAEYLDAYDVSHVAFYEPDISQHTALATAPLMGSRERKPLRKFTTYR